MYAIFTVEKKDSQGRITTTVYVKIDPLGWKEIRDKLKANPQVEQVHYHGMVNRVVSYDGQDSLNLESSTLLFS